MDDSPRMLVQVIQYTPCHVKITGAYKILTAYSGFWLQCVNCEVAGAGSHLHHYLDCCLAEGGGGGVTGG